MLKLTPFLLFDGQCAEAMRFYHSCFGGDLTLVPLSETPMAAQFPPEHHNKITNARLINGAVELTATDWLHPTRKPVQGNMAALYVTADRYEELSSVFERLRDGADAALLVELHAMPFGIYGRMTDRYGVEWFFRGANVNP